MSLERLTYASGFTAYVDQMPWIHTNNVAMFVPYGSVHEKDGEEGIAHAFEHCLYLQTGRYKNMKKLDLAAEINGLSCNADTYLTRTRYYANGMRLEGSIDYLNQVLFTPTFPEKKIAHEMKAIRREAVTALDKINDLHNLAATQSAFGSPYGRSVIGFHDRLDFDRSKLLEVYKRNYAIGNMTLIVVGCASSEEVDDVIRRYFDVTDMNPNAVADRTPSRPVSEAEGVTSGFSGGDSPNIQLSRIYPFDLAFVKRLKDNHMLYEIATDVLSDVFYVEARNKAHISYDGSVELMTYNHPTAWAIGADITVDPCNVKTAQAIFDKIFSQGSAAYSTKRCLAALQMQKYHLLTRLDSKVGRGNAHFEKLEQYCEPEDTRKTIQLLESLTPDDIKMAIDTLIAYISTARKFDHLTGKSKYLSHVDRMINPDEIA